MDLIRFFMSAFVIASSLFAFFAFVAFFDNPMRRVRRAGSNNAHAAPGADLDP